MKNYTLKFNILSLKSLLIYLFAVLINADLVLCIFCKCKARFI